MAQKLGSAFVIGLFFLMLLILTVTLSHEALEQRFDSGRPLPLVFTGEKGRTYKCMQTSINIRIQGHIMILTKVGAAHTMQEVYESLGVHDLGRSVTIFVTLHAHQPTKGFFIVTSSHCTKLVLTATAILHCLGSTISASKPLPIDSTCHVHWSIKRARTIRLNLIANAGRPNPRGSSHYGAIPIVRILLVEITAAEAKPYTYKKFPTETEPFLAETKPSTYKKFPAKTEPFPAKTKLFPAETKHCSYKKFSAETKPSSHVVHSLPRNHRKLLGKVPDVTVRSPPATSNKTSWNLDKEDPPSPPAPCSNQPIHD